MGALYAQGLPWDQAHRKVRMYASRMSSVRHLLQVRVRPNVLCLQAESEAKGSGSSYKAVSATSHGHVAAPMSRLGWGEGLGMCFSAGPAVADRRFGCWESCCVPGNASKQDGQ